MTATRTRSLFARLPELAWVSSLNRAPTSLLEGEVMDEVQGD